MNPWEIVSWIGAVSVALLIVVVTVSVIVGIIRNATKPDKPTTPPKPADRFDDIIASSGMNS
jgi:hypothetical protein